MVPAAYNLSCIFETYFDVFGSELRGIGLVSDSGLCGFQKRRGCATIILEFRGERFDMRSASRCPALLALLVLVFVFASCTVKSSSGESKETVSATAQAQETSKEVAPAQTATTGKIYGKVQKSGGADCSDVIVTITGEPGVFTATADAEGNWSAEVPAGNYTRIEFAGSCWSARRARKFQLAGGQEIHIEDYKLSVFHSYEVVDSRKATTEEAGYETYRCSVCGYEETEWTEPISPVEWAGIRVSSYGIRGSFGRDNPFPSPDEMSGFISKVKSCYEGSKGACILIVGTVSESTWDCHLAFPLSHDIDRVNGSEEDFYEAYLDAFDEAGYEVWLQVEPGEADLIELAKEVLNRYKDHPSVKGFGIDVEWHETAGTDGYGTPLTDEEAAEILAVVREINPEYTVFVKHWDSGWLPDPADGLIFVNDSQQFRSLDEMKEEFSSWAYFYEPCPVMFQIGYNADKRVWGKMENPVLELGTALQNECTYGNVLGIIWVDFTLKEAVGKIN